VAARRHDGVGSQRVDSQDRFSCRCPAELRRRAGGSIRAPRHGRRPLRRVPREAGREERSGAHERSAAGVEDGVHLVELDPPVHRRPHDADARRRSRYVEVLGGATALKAVVCRHPRTSHSVGGLGHPSLRMSTSPPGWSHSGTIESCFEHGSERERREMWSVISGQWPDEERQQVGGGRTTDRRPLTTAWVGWRGRYNSPRWRG
jgi:hypothetical protein